MSGKLLNFVSRGKIMKNNIISINEVTIPDSFLQSRKTGIQLLDPFLSMQGGLVPSMSYMFTGESGSGKTTISNYIMSGISTEDNPAVFLSLEMSKEQVKYQFEGKVDFSNTFIVDSIPDKTLDGFQNLLDAIDVMRPSIFVIDSLQMISALIFGDPTSIKGQSEIAKMIMRFSKDTGCPTLLIGQCNKDGDYLGPTFVKHIFDAHLHASIDKKTSGRSLMFEKNRFGKVGEMLSYKFTDDGGVQFMQGGVKHNSVLSQDFTWFKADDMVRDLFSTILKDELDGILKRGGSIPQLVLGSNFEDRYFLYVDHASNSLYINTTYCRRFFTEDHSKDLQERFREFTDRYPVFQKPHEFFYLAVISITLYGVLNSSEHTKLFWKTMDKIVHKLT